MPVEQIAGQYQATPKVFGDGQTVLVQVDSEGNMKIVGGGTPGTPSSGVLTTQGIGYTSTASFTRQNNATPYDAGDVVGALAAALTFSGIGPSGGGHVLITKAEFEIDVAAVPSGMAAFNLQLYSVTPPSAYADAATWDLPSGDRTSYLGSINLGTPVDLGATLYVKVTGLNEQYVIPSGGALYGYLVTTGAYTPTALAVYSVKLKSISV